ncbi:hypothetical protein COS86_00070 [Candidatus Bathyarchaeota archaeon CG07_land_8_20_14_0_80_47_9]|nr:MAG: hypothetical protein COS86_00070 [Candidatus Bathyarchaeota archaeon CG07_land_8_20_14_0_80_47_9]
MGLLDRFRKKKEVENISAESTKITTELEKFCGSDKETYEALLNTMALDPRKIGTPLKEAVENAKKAEKEKDSIIAREWYRVAGSLAIYEGSAKKAAEFFNEAQRIFPGEKFPFLKNPEKAVAKAQEYYKKHLT